MSTLRALTRSLLGFLLSVVIGLAVFTYRNQRRIVSDETQLTAATARETLVGRVVRVSDGDTIAVQVNTGQKPTKIRILGIDAPEKKQPFGEVCRRKLAGWVGNRQVEILVFSKDRYGRLLGKVLESDPGSRPRDYGLEMVASGCAWHYRHFARNQPQSDRVTYARAEQGARDTQLGLWKELATALPPWEYRRIMRARSLASQGKQLPPALAESRELPAEELPPEP